MNDAIHQEDEVLCLASAGHLQSRRLFGASSALSRPAIPRPTNFPRTHPCYDGSWKDSTSIAELYLASHSLRACSWDCVIHSLCRDTWDKSPEERRFLAKLDACLLTYAALSYFSKYLDQQNVTVRFAFTDCVVADPSGLLQNAYVSGMKTE